MVDTLVKVLVLVLALLLQEPPERMDMTGKHFIHFFQNQSTDCKNMIFCYRITANT